MGRVVGVEAGQILAGLRASLVYMSWIDWMTSGVFIAALPIALLVLAWRGCRLFSGREHSPDGRTGNYCRLACGRGLGTVPRPLRVCRRRQ